jgi:hypothetical protein
MAYARLWPFMPLTRTFFEAASGIEPLYRVLQTLCEGEHAY